MKRFGALLITAALASLALAGKAPKDFTQIQGVREFSGRLIVRPLQPSAITPGKLTFAQYKTRRARGVSRVTKQSIVHYYPETDEYIVKVTQGKTDSEMARELAASGDYAYVTPDWIVYPTREPNDPQLSGQWHHTMMKSRQAWDITIGSPDITVAIVDTGVDHNHPDLQASLVSGYNSVDKLSEADGGDTSPVHPHGTHCAGCAAAIGDNNEGVVGMGWNFKIMPIRTSNSSGGGAMISDMMDGARWAAEHGAKTASVSYSGVDSTDSIGTTGTYLKTIGSLLLYAAGNEGREINSLDFPDVIVVAASDESDLKAGFSNYGSMVDLMAPGVNILATVPGGGYEAWSGTSMATPIVNGGLAMIWSANPDLTPDDVQNVLFDNCDRVGDPAQIGHGRINQYANVYAADLGPRIELPAVTATPLVGTHTTGVLAGLHTAQDGQTYAVQSALSKLGQLASLETTYTIPDVPSTVNVLEINVRFYVTPKVVGAGGFLSIYNYSTRKWVSLKNFSPPTDDSTLITVTLKSNCSQYIGPSGTVKLGIQANSPYKMKKPAPLSFTLYADYVSVTYRAKVLH